MRKFLVLFVLALGLSNCLWAFSGVEVPIGPADLTITVPEVIMEGPETAIQVQVDPNAPAFYQSSITLRVNGRDREVTLTGGKGEIPMSFYSKDEELTIKTGNFEFRQAVHPIPLWLSLIPPLLAILLALVFREVLSAIGLGIFSGAAIIGFYNEGVSGIFSGLLAVVDTYIINSLNDTGHLSIIVFSMLIGSLVAVISRNGGMQGAVNRIAAYAQSPRSGQFATWALGVAIFFDDYANTLVVGNTMRSVTDRLRISREKLAYLVDSTAAPVAAIAFVTTWIGAELGYIESGISGIEEIKANESVYSIFLNSLAYSFYPIFTLAFMLILIRMKRDYGPMYHAEVRARTTGQVSRSDAQVASGSEADEFNPDEGVKPKAYNALIPILCVIGGTMAGIWVTGFDAEVWNDANISFSVKLSKIVGGSDSYVALLWSSAFALVVAILLTISQRLLSLAKTMDAVMSGFKTMLPAIVILVLAWSLAGVTEHLHTADFLANSLSDKLSPIAVPALTFVLAALVAFSTGSSWGTMAILYPLLIPTTWEITQVAGWEYVDTMPILYNVVASVLAGAVLGDHCSPISDTTILSSLASSCNHIDHVRTQLPYALTVGGVAIVIGILPAALGLPSWILFPVGIGILYLVVRTFGKEVPAN